jgi:hypothetical protein
MMNLIKLAVISMGFLAVPAMAQPISETHELHWAQAGKIPTATYRPIKQACAQKVSPVHLAGRTPLIVHPKDSNCVTRVAKTDANRAVAQD